MPHHPFPAKSHHIHHTLHLFVNMPLNKVSAAFRHPHSCAFALENTRWTLLKCLIPRPLFHVLVCVRVRRQFWYDVSNICFSFHPPRPPRQQCLDRKHSSAGAGQEARVRFKKTEGGGGNHEKRDIPDENLSFIHLKSFILAVWKWACKYRRSVPDLLEFSFLKLDFLHKDVRNEM